MRLDQAASAPQRLLLLLLGLAARGWGLRVSGVVVPSAVVSGSSVQLTCNYEHNTDRPDPLYSVKWYRDVNQFYEYIPKRDPPIRIYPLPHIHVDESGSSGPMVRLTGVTRATSGIFRCEVMSDKPYFETDDHAVNMTVVDIPRWGPEIKGEVKSSTHAVQDAGVGMGTGTSVGMLEGARVRPGDVLEASCQVDHSDPPAEITWTVNSATPPLNTHFRRPHKTDRRGRRIQALELEAVVGEAWFMRGALALACHARVSSVFRQSANVTLIHADHPQPAGFGWFSSASSQWVSLVVMVAAVLLPITLV
ncbi:uncharacterized protein [Cherax quadricarinatus]|uniref:uncharacterized protein n=1 Tax=Cherax quadricarinatus TaxID=27406 RepID=UPI002379E7F8|nr:uncharacterized protein LOC128696148 [Cherax quadricarinatus]XP_053643266.1 uncharacterized protein LOC128696148 [Cherax quadricarinatus]XP_053643275.1 uncharacterized protein LOC128696148 [Cherax quadricarinatus]